MYPFIHAITALLAGSLGTLFENALEWSATLVSLVAFYMCILKKPSSFLVFLWADASWGLSAIFTEHWALVVQQVLYMAMNVAGYLIWKREAAEELLWESAYRDLQQQVKQLSAKLAEFELDDEEVEVPKPAAAKPAEMNQAVVAGSPAGEEASLKAASAAMAESTSCLASVRSAASCSPAR